MNTFIEKLMFRFWSINPGIAFGLSLVLPIFILAEAFQNGVLFEEPLLTIGLAAAMFYIVNGLLRFLDDWI